MFVFMSNNTAIFTTVLDLTQHHAAYETKIQICLEEKKYVFQKTIKTIYANPSDHSLPRCKVTLPITCCEI